jgi:hypothetical protein
MKLSRRSMSVADHPETEPPLKKRMTRFPHLIGIDAHSAPLQTYQRHA